MSYNDLKLEYWWIIIPGAFLFAWLLSMWSKSGKTASKMPNVSFSADGRSGEVHYRSQEGNLDLYYEFGGAEDVLAIIDVPSEKDWMRATTIPLSKRLEVLHFIGQQTAALQVSGGRGRYEIQGDSLLIRMI